MRAQIWWSHWAEASLPTRHCVCALVSNTTSLCSASPLALTLGGHSNMKVTGMCLPENENGSFGVGFRKKGVIGCGIFKNWAFLGVNFPKKGVIRCKFCQIWVQIHIFQLKNGRKLKCYIEIYTKRGPLGWDCCKIRDHWCKICKNNGVFWQTDDIGPHIGVPPPCMNSSQRQVSMSNIPLGKPIYRCLSLYFMFVNNLVWLPYTRTIIIHDYFKTLPHFFVPTRCSLMR